ncbi:MAG: TonB-dependent receptor [Gammaproteobacteria bacterium]|nr:TonB-dependent receptor [Gammaproteobacteria bacterium]
MITLSQEDSDMRGLSRLILPLPPACLAFVFFAADTQAQPAGAGESAQPAEEILVVGSRRRDRSADDSPVPVDVISGDDFLAQGDSDMDSLLSALVPSYNVSQEPISDAATLVRPATLRSLPPDATLVLVNGKRRHRAAVIALLGAGISGGSQGPDLSVIPAIALDRLEVLRDGASAQYGSDAIAGIMNFVLKEDDSGFTLDTKWGSHFEGDGDALTIAGNAGFGLSDAGFANISFEFKEQDPTSRSVQRADAQGLINAGNTSVRQPAAQIWGAPEISDDFKLFGNFGIDLGGGAEAYMFGNWAERQVEGGFYFRNPHTRGGVFLGPTLADGRSSVKVADLSGDMSGNCPAVGITNNVPDADALASIRNNPNCYSLIEKFPGGFTPQFGGYVDDISLAGGVRGELDSGWFYDISAVAGQSGADFYIYNTINPQLLSRRNDIPTYYDAGGYVETDRVVNFDLSRQFFPSNVDSVNVAMGLEYRDETFTIRNGEPNSFFIDPNLAAQGFGVGSNGFPGFQPGDAGDNTVRAYGAYIDVESNVNEFLLIGAALRFEDYADFGDTLDGKLAARLQVADNVAIRGAVSTGFRVPTAGQANLRNVTTEFNMGRLADIATLPPTNPIAQQKGATPLTPEESINTTLGLVFTAGAWDVTVDYYNIEISDRISFTSRFNLTEEDIASLLAAGVSDAQSFTSVRFFSNQQTVEASGIDLVATVPFDLGQGDSTLTFVANWSDIELTDFSPEFTSDNRRRQIERGRPDFRYTATWSHRQGPWRFMARARYFGEYYDAPTNDASVSYYPDPSVLFDFEAGYEVNDSLNVIAGLQNAFDEYPMTNPAGEVAGLIYPEQSPFGFNGGFYYLRATWSAF